MPRPATDLIEALAKEGAPPDAIEILKAWDSDRLWRELRKRAKSWTQVHAIYADAAPMGSAH